jgi:MFS superfamily sulfate permease-like transporter
MVICWIVAGVTVACVAVPLALLAFLAYAATLADEMLEGG